MALGFGCDWDNTDALASAWQRFKHYHTVCCGEKCVILANIYVQAGLNSGATLANQDITSEYILSRKTLYT
jgi:hypothetical protein